MNQPTEPIITGVPGMLRVATQGTQLPADSMEFRKRRIADSAFTSSGQHANALFSIRSDNTAGSTNSETSITAAEHEEVADEVLVASVSLNEPPKGATPSIAFSKTEIHEAAEEAALSLSYDADSYSSILEGADVIPPTPVSNVTSEKEIPHLTPELLKEDEEEFTSRGLHKPAHLTNLPECSYTNPPLKSPTKVENPKVLSLQMPRESFASSISSWHSLLQSFRYDYELPFAIPATSSCQR